MQEQNQTHFSSFDRVVALQDELSVTVSPSLLLSLPTLCSINSSKVVLRFERFGLGILEPSNPKL